MKYGLIGLSLLFSASLLAQNKPRYDYVPCQEMPAIMQDFKSDYQLISAFYSPATGGGFGGQRMAENDNGSSEKKVRIEKLYREYLNKLKELDFNGLSQECKVDYILFKRNLNDKLETLANYNSAHDKIKAWLPFEDKIYATEKLRRRGTQQNAQQLAAEWNGIARQIDSLLKALPDARIELPLLFAAEDQITDLKNALSSTYAFYNGYDPQFTWWVPNAYSRLDSTLNLYKKALDRKTKAFVANDNTGIVGKPVGREELMKQLKFEMIPYTPDELIDLANKEFAWCDAEMLKASKEMGFGADWKSAVEKVKNSYEEPGKQPEAIMRLYNESMDFVKKHDLITIPPVAEEIWRMGMMSPERQLVNPFFTGGLQISISYPTNTMAEDDKLMSMKGNNPHFSRSTVFHELIPGHELQAVMNSRSRTYRNFDTPFWTEGWSLYWELLLWDKGFPQGPEDRIGMLFWHMTRCARIIFSLNYHMGKWTPKQCIDFLVDRVDYERANAEGEVRRSFEGRYSPLYQVGYLTGGHQFYALEKELVGSKKMTIKQYHDAVIKLNAMPVEMIRAILTHQKLDKDFTTQWRFYNDK